MVQDGYPGSRTRDWCKYKRRTGCGVYPTDAPYRTDANAYALLSEGTFAIESDGSGEIQIKNITVNVIDESTIDINAQLAEANDEQNDEIIKLHQSDFPY
mgnify:CR=1 FL=1